MGEWRMTSDIDIINKLIIQEALVAISKDQYHKNFLVLHEHEQKKSPGYNIKVLNTPEDTIAIKTDRFPFTQRMFRCKHNECKMADYVIIANDGVKKWMIYIELKKGKNGNSRQIIK